MGSFLPIIVKARVYERKDRPGRWIVAIYWKGRLYRRSHYDKIHPLLHLDMAVQIAGAINAAIAQDPDGFDPRQWFHLDSDFAFDRFAADWLRDRTAHYAPSVIRDVHRYVNRAIDHFQDQDIRSVKLIHIEKWVLSVPGSNKTKRNALAVLHKMFSDAFRLELIPRIPGFPRLEVVDPEIRWLTREQQEAVLAHIPERDKPLIVFLFTYGCRIGEARALQWQDINFDSETLVLKRSYSGRVLRDQTKTRNIRYLPLVEPVTSMLRGRRGLAGQVFRNFYGRPYSAEISRVWRQAVVAAGLPPITLYAGVRHSWASQRVNAGVGLAVIKEVLGHTTIGTTQRYAAVSMDSKRKVME